MKQKTIKIKFSLDRLNNLIGLINYAKNVFINYNMPEMAIKDLIEQEQLLNKELENALK